MAAILEKGPMAARGQFDDGSTSKFFHIFVYLCAKIGAFIKKIYNMFKYPS